MERESFEHEPTARYLNEHFVAIKVDREERPDLDQVYMAAVQAMTGSGGWPMSVFLTPDGRPFYGGTYFPDEPRHGMPSFRQVLEGVDAGVARAARPGVEAAGGRLVGELVEQSRPASPADDPTPVAARRGRRPRSRPRSTRDNGGWGRAPKFPQPMTIEFLLRRHAATGDRAAARGGPALARRDGRRRDPRPARWRLPPLLDGRRSWLVPHFEQMLYDNAQLARVYVHAWALTGDARYRAVATGTLDYMLRELTTDDGAFAASQDADTDGIEGLTFTWRAAEIREVLGDDAPLFEAAYGVTDDGQLGGRHDPVAGRADDDALAEAFGSPPSEVAARLAQLAGGCSRVAANGRSRRATTRRSRRGTGWPSRPSPTPPVAARGDRCGPRRALSRGRAACCETIVDGLLGAGRRPRAVVEGRSGESGRASSRTTRTSPTACSPCTRRRSTSAGSRSPRALMDRVLERFADPAGGFFDTADDHERLVTRPKDVQDNAVPSGNAMAARVLLRLAALDRRGPLSRRRRAGAPDGRPVRRPVPDRVRPVAVARWTSSLAPVVEVAIVGALDDAGDRAPARRGPARRSGRTRSSRLAADPSASGVPLLADRIAVDGRPTAYVCRVVRVPAAGHRARGARDAELERLSVGAG